MSLIAKKNRLQQRQNIIRSIRATLDERGYLEISAPLLIRGTNPDAFLTSFEVFVDEKFQGYLTTSTEFQLLRLLANGYDKMYSIASNFRFGDLDRTHNPEFTMLEWEALGDMKQIEQEAEAVVRAAAESIGVKIVATPWQKISVREVFKKYLNLEIAPDFSLASMVEEIKKVGLKAPENFFDDRDVIFSWLIDKISPNLGIEAPTWVTEWPIFQTSMAEPLSDNPKLADRSELYINGLEIANGFATVSDVEKQKTLFEAQQKKRIIDGKKPVTIDEKYLNDLSGCVRHSPATADKNLKAAGMAIGIDRLIMVLTEASSIDEVVAFGWNEL